MSTGTYIVKRFITELYNGDEFEFEDVIGAYSYKSWAIAYAAKVAAEEDRHTVVERWRLNKPEIEPVTVYDSQVDTILAREIGGEG